jgi:hypothetical protein
MLTKVQKPKTKQDLIKALHWASVQAVSVYEGTDVNLIPSKSDLIRQKASVIIVR